METEDGRRVFMSGDAFLHSLNQGATVSAKDMIAALDEAELRAQIAAEIEAFADDHSDVSDAYRHAALIAKGTQP